MFASSLESRTKRRGIVLVLVLGMLGLMALIGVTFATFAGQSLIAARNVQQGVARPQAETLMDYALGQLINDTNNPLSALRGHSLLRDMYGNDSVFRGSNPAANPASETRGLLSTVYVPGVGTQNLKLQYHGPRASGIGPSPTPFYNQIQYVTNIPTSGQYFGLDFTRWILRFQGAPANPGVVTNQNVPINGNASATYEVLEDVAPPGGFHVFTLSNNLTNPTVDPFNSAGNPPPSVSSDWATFNYVDANFMSPNAMAGYGVVGPNTNGVYSFVKAWASLAREWAGGTFVLDGRYMRAFNGPGLTRSFGSPALAPSLFNLYPYNVAAFANFRVTSSIANPLLFPLTPDSWGMDEDYDACDLENWFLAMQSADGQIVIPSFHRPSILTGPSAPLTTNAFGFQIPNDWTLNPGGGNPKILRPRQIDNSPLFPADPSTPDANGKLTYDVDNDGDGITDSVWLDLGYPVQRDPGGKLYKPLFAFMVIGLNGRLPLNTVGNLQARATADTSNNMLAAPPMGTPPLPNSTGQVPYPGIQTDSTGLLYKAAPINGYFTAVNPGGVVVTSQTYLDAPLWDHASHLGYSVNEINPKFALQNAPSNAFATAVDLNGNTIPANVNGHNYSQVDDAGVSVALTQMRNILAGTIPTDLTYPYPGGYPITALNSTTKNGDVNAVMVNGQIMVLPNNMADQRDIPGPNGFIARNLPAVPGRWGETSAVQQFTSLLHPPGSSPFFGLSLPGLIYQNPVRAGRSAYTNLTNDVMDDDFDGVDPVLTAYPFPLNLYFREPTAALTTVASNQITVPARNVPGGYPANPDIPEFADTFDTIGQRAVAIERIRQFVTPIDPGGVGRVVDFMNRPNSDNDYGKGYDTKGRASYFRYYRAPGMPQDIRYPYGGVPPAPMYTYGVGGPTYSYPYTPSTLLTPSTSYLGQRFLMPQLFPAGFTYSAYNPGSYPATGASDIHSNRYHGFQSMMTPEIAGSVTPQIVAAMAATPYDWDNSTVMLATPPTPVPDVPLGYPTMSASTPYSPLPIGPPLGTNFVNNFAPTINPFATGNQASSLTTPYVLGTSVATSHGPNLGTIGNTTIPPGTGAYPIAYAFYGPNSEPYSNPSVVPPLPGAQVVNGYLGGSLNKDEADEMNLYVSNSFDQPYGPSDLEWLYRLQDVDGATLNSRLSKLAPVSFLNPADGLTRRRLFSTDSWEPTGFVYANDNPAPYAGAAYGNSTDHNFAYNSRFTPFASPSLEIMNQIDGSVNNEGVAFPNFANSGYASPQYVNTQVFPPAAAVFANPLTTQYLPNPTFPSISPVYNTSFTQVIPNTSLGASSLPLNIVTGSNYLFPLIGLPQVTNLNPNILVNGGFNNTMVQVQTPTLSHRDRKINLNMPLPISHDPAEPVRQKWCRETYQMLKAILPPASVDTPEELAALSQFVVNIIDFRDPDCTMTRFVNTDLIVTDVLTKSTSNVQPTALPGTPLPAGAYGYDDTWNVSPAGVRFATAADAINLTTTITTPAPNSITQTVTHFPYDPSIYSPDVTTPFLVQHGMEYNPIAINEVFGFQVPYGSLGSIGSIYKGLFIELVNTLTEEQNNTNSNNNSSAIPLQGWDLVIAPDDYGWGRPDPISGDVSSIAYPPKLPNPGMTTGITVPPNTGAGNPLTKVKQYSFTSATDVVQALNGNMANTNVLVVGTSIPSGAIVSGTSPVTNLSSVTGNMDTNYLPASFVPTLEPGKMAQYYWVYLRRPANPFDTAALNGDRPNREMVVVDAMRFPYINAGTASVTGAPGEVVTLAPNQVYSARRLQPYRGGHLLPVATKAGTPANFDANGNMGGSAANGVTTICPPSPPYAYGYSEQMSPANATTNTGGYVTISKSPTYKPTTKVFRESLGSLAGGPLDTNWAHMPFNDRDFTSVAELLLVPGCPPGLFTKQFVEEPYPGNIVTQLITTTKTTPMMQGNVTYSTGVIYYDPNNAFLNPLTNPPAMNLPMQMQQGNGMIAKGTDDSTFPTFPSPIVAPTIYLTNSTIPTTATNPQVQVTTVLTQPVGGRTDFNEITTVTGAPSTPVAPTYPYLPHNFYYTAASVAPPPKGNGYPAYYQNLTTEIGGWTGNGWHKMMEFFEVPSSANGAVGTADNGNNFDWARADVKPGLLNLNLIIDEEVFAGLFDDPRLNERLAVMGAGSGIPRIVTQVDGNGFASSQYLMSNLLSVNQLNLPQDLSYYPNQTNNPVPAPQVAGRGYVVRDADSQNYSSINPPVPPPFPYQQLHGLKAAFADFLKLRHGGSGFLFAHGAGPTGSGNVGSPVSFPIAADRPYRSLSYPDINYTVMRPASLPPSALDVAVPARWAASTPSVPPALTTLYNYAVYQPQENNAGNNTFVQLALPVAPMSIASVVAAGGGAGLPVQMPFGYVADPGVENPYLSVQYANTTNPDNGATAVQAPPSYGTTGLQVGVGGPPYPALPFATRSFFTPLPTPALPAAPFPPPIPPTPARRLIQLPDIDTSSAIAPAYPNSNASVPGQYDGTGNPVEVLLPPTPAGTPITIPPVVQILPEYNVITAPTANSAVNAPVNTLMLYSGNINPPTLFPQTRAIFGNILSVGPDLVSPDNNTPQASTTYNPQTAPMGTTAIPAGANNYLGAGRRPSFISGFPATNDNRQHPLYQTEMLQKIMNLTTVRTHQYAVWITVGFFEVVRAGTPELGIPDMLGQELGLTAGRNVRYRSFFTLDRTQATGFNPYYPGDFRDCVTYRRRIE
jgi:hypothetical protein